MIAPRFVEVDGVPVAYGDGTPTLTRIMDALLASDPETTKFMDVAVVGTMAVARSDLRQGKAQGPGMETELQRKGRELLDHLEEKYALF